jgi:hypothetical protein
MGSCRVLLEGRGLGCPTASASGAAVGRRRAAGRRVPNWARTASGTGHLQCARAPHTLPSRRQTRPASSPRPCRDRSATSLRAVGHQERSREPSHCVRAAVRPRARPPGRNAAPPPRRRAPRAARRRGRRQRSGAAPEARRGSPCCEQRPAASVARRPLPRRRPHHGGFRGDRPHAGADQGGRRPGLDVSRGRRGGLGRQGRAAGNGAAGAGGVVAGPGCCAPPSERTARSGPPLCRRRCRLPTPVQAEAMPLILGGGDVMAVRGGGGGRESRVGAAWCVWRGGQPARPGRPAWWVWRGGAWASPSGPAPMQLAHAARLPPARRPPRRAAARPG